MVPLDSCVADTQGAIGYHIQLALHNEFRRLGIEKGAATVVTQCLVDREDPAFARPNKPIGSFLPKEQADHHKAVDGWDVVEDAGRGWRRVVASPAPKAILELDAVKSLLEAGFVVVAAGGGGIAVVPDENGELKGASAVIDKDFASSLLARQIGAQLAGQEARRVVLVDDRGGARQVPGGVGDDRDSPSPRRHDDEAGV